MSPLCSLKVDRFPVAHQIGQGLHYDIMTLNDSFTLLIQVHDFRNETLNQIQSVWQPQPQIFRNQSLPNNQHSYFNPILNCRQWKTFNAATWEETREHKSHYFSFSMHTYWCIREMYVVLSPQEVYTKSPHRPISHFFKHTREQTRILQTLDTLTPYLLWV